MSSRLLTVYFLNQHLGDGEKLGSIESMTEGSTLNISEDNNEGAIGTAPTNIDEVTKNCT